MLTWLLIKQMDDNSQSGVSLSEDDIMSFIGYALSPGTALHEDIMT